MIKKYKKIILFICLIAIFALPRIILANPVLDKLDNVATQAGPYSPADDTTLTGLIGLIIGVVLSLIGVIFLILMIYAGYNWMTAQGEEEKVTRAKDTIIRALIGLIIIIGAYAIWRFVFSKLF